MRHVPSLGGTFCDIIGPENYFRRFEIKLVIKCLSERVTKIM